MPDLPPRLLQLLSERGSPLWGARNLEALEAGPLLLGELCGLPAVVERARDEQLERLTDGSWRSDPWLRRLSEQAVEEDPQQAVLGAPVVVPFTVMPFGDFVYPGFFEDEEFSIDTKFARTMVRNFKRYQRKGHEPFVTYGHVWDMGAAPADAWTIGLAEDGSKLHGELKLLPHAAADVGGDRYRYYSATYHPAWRDETGKEIGPTLLSGALTNFPFFTGMESPADGLAHAEFVAAALSPDGELMTLSRGRRSRNVVACSRRTAGDRAMADETNDRADEPQPTATAEEGQPLSAAERQELDRLRTENESLRGTMNELGGRFEALERRDVIARVREVVENARAANGGPMRMSRAFIDEYLPGYFDEAPDAPLKALQASPLFRGDATALEAWVKHAPVIARVGEQRLSGDPGSASGGVAQAAVSAPRVLSGGRVEVSEEWARSIGFGGKGAREGESAVQHFQRCQQENSRRRSLAGISS